MTARLIDGKTVAREVEQEVAAQLEELRSHSIIPSLVVVRVGEDPASAIYVRNKARKAQELGFRGGEKLLSANVSEQDLLAELDRLNGDDDVDGVLLQLPLPDHIDTKRMLLSIDPRKDVDGFHPINVGKLHLGEPALAPCTPSGVIRLLESTDIDIAGKHAVVVGRSDIVGKPVAAMLLQRHATVTICHSRTHNLAVVVRQGEIVVAAVGKPMMIRGEMIREGAVVLDVGINRLERGSNLTPRLEATKLAALEKNGSVLVGDVDFGEAAARASWITPVPGGVGPMTIAMLMRNTLQAARERRR